MKLMYSFARPDSGDATIPEINGHLTEIIRMSHDVPETVEVTVDADSTATARKSTLHFHMFGGLMLISAELEPALF